MGTLDTVVLVFHILVGIILIMFSIKIIKDMIYVKLGKSVENNFDTTITSISFITSYMLATLVIGLSIYFLLG